MGVGDFFSGVVSWVSKTDGRRPVAYFLTRAEQAALTMVAIERAAVDLSLEGGDLAFAQALVQVLGEGEVQVLTSSAGAVHAVAAYRGLLVDIDGPGDLARLAERLQLNEGVAVSASRPLLPGDLPDAVRDEALVSALVAALPPGMPGRLQEVAQHRANPRPKAP